MPVTACTPAQYVLGSGVTTLASFRDSDLVPADPTTVRLLVGKPDGNTVTLTYPADLSRSSAGEYSATFTVDQPGTWFYRWEGTGAVIAAAETSIVVGASHFY